jgi:hypothetical protein
MLLDRLPIRARWITLCETVCKWQIWCFPGSCGVSSPIKLTATTNWNILAFSTINQNQTHGLPHSRLARLPLPHHGAISDRKRKNRLFDRTMKCILCRNIDKLRLNSSIAFTLMLGIILPMTSFKCCCSGSERCVIDHVFVIHKIIKVVFFTTNFTSLPFVTIYNSRKTQIIIITKKWYRIIFRRELFLLSVA